MYLMIHRITFSRKLKIFMDNDKEKFYKTFDTLLKTIK